LFFVQVNFAPYFVAGPGKATVEKVADHVEHIANVAGKLQYVSFLQFASYTYIDWF
jgi:microsomal dipeptidase-like Zn-dependent dipeptidase